jgi:hypothetical protein
MQEFYFAKEAILIIRHAQYRFSGEELCLRWPVSEFSRFESITLPITLVGVRQNDHFHDDSSDNSSNDSSGRNNNSFAKVMRVIDKALQSRCQIPHDKVFGIRSILGALGFHIPPPDYRKPLGTICEEFMTTLFRSTASLEALHAFAPLCKSSAHGFPSWVPELTRDTKRSAILSTEKCFLNPAILYESSPSSHGINSIKLEPGKLIVRGFIFGKIGNVFSRSLPQKLEDFMTSRWLFRFLLQKSNIFNILARVSEVLTLTYQWFHLLTENSHIMSTETRNNLFRQFWERCIPDPEEADYHEIETLVYVATSLGVKTFVEDISHELARRGSWGLENLYDVVPDSKLWQDFIFSNNFAGVALPGSQEGDVIALIHGAVGELILRPSGSEYQFVGPAILAGIPDEAWPRTGKEESLQQITIT